MSSRAIVIVIAALIVGFTAMSLRSYFTQAPVVVEAAPAAPKILVAKRALSSGEFVQVAQDLDWADAPANKTEADEANYQYDNTVKLEEFAGAVVRRQIAVGEPIPPDALMKAGEGGFLSAVLGAGMRAVSISVNITSGNAGFISPGDKVDLLVTHRIQVGGKESGANDQVVTETFAHNVRVLAVDQTLTNPENKAILAKTITVEVTPEQAEQVSVATEMGKISMSLVSTGAPAEAGEAKLVAVDGEVVPNTHQYTIDGDVSKLLGKKEESFSKVRVIRGDKIETLEFYQDK